ncbi:hypothetical protein Droror1_Dr00015211 [Drosera rotundifolia]
MQHHIDPGEPLLLPLFDPLLARWSSRPKFDPIYILHSKLILLSNNMHQSISTSLSLCCSRSQTIFDYHSKIPLSCEHPNLLPSSISKPHPKQQELSPYSCFAQTTNMHDTQLLFHE